MKVAENYEHEPVELEESTAGEQLSARVTDALEQGLPKVELQLSPASLGNLTVEISKDVNGQLNIVFRPTPASIWATRTQTAAMTWPSRRW